MTVSQRINSNNIPGIQYPLLWGHQKHIQKEVQGFMKIKYTYSFPSVDRAREGLSARKKELLLILILTHIKYLPGGFFLI